MNTTFKYCYNVLISKMQNRFSVLFLYISTIEYATKLPFGRFARLTFRHHACPVSIFRSFNLWSVVCIYQCQEMLQR